MDVKRALGLPLFVLGVAGLGAGVPLLWVWIASRLEHRLTGGVSVLPMAVMIVGLLTTYLVLTLVAQRISRPRDARVRRPSAWNASLGSERRHPADGSTVESLFVTTTVVVAVLTDIYLVFFAHPGVPAGP